MFNLKKVKELEAREEVYKQLLNEAGKLIETLKFLLKHSVMNLTKAGMKKTNADIKELKVEIVREGERIDVKALQELEEDIEA